MDCGFLASIGVILIIIIINLVVYFIYRAPKLFLKGCRLHKKGDYPRAAECFRKAVKLKPVNGMYMMAYAVALDKLNEHEKAESYFDRSVEIDPDNYLLYAARGHHHSLARNLDKAEADLLRSIELRDDYFEPHYNIACIFSLKGDLPGARKHLERSLQLGYRDFDSIMKDGTLAFIMSDESTREMIQRYRPK